LARHGRLREGAGATKSAAPYLLSETEGGL